MPTIFISAGTMIHDLKRFRPLFAHHEIDLIVPEVHERLSEEHILRHAGQFDGALCGDDPFTERVLVACSPRLKVVSKWGTGIDSIDRVAAARLGIQVRNTPNAFTLPVADTALGFMLAFARCQPWVDRAIRAGRWDKLPGRSLSECTLGVIGVGNCGKAVLRRGGAFGMRLLGNDVLEVAPDFLVENQVEMTSLEDLLRRADFVSLNCDLNSTSYHLINADTLSLMKPTAVLVNTARGKVVDEPALCRALQQGIIAGAGLDVFEVEPLPKDSPLLHLDNVLLSPHNANSSPAAWERVHKNTIRNLFDGLDIPFQEPLYGA